MAAPISFSDYNRLVTRLLAAIVDQAAWLDFLADLSRITGGGTYTHVLGHDTASGLHLGDLTHGYDPAWGPAYYQHFHKVNPWLARADQHPVGRAIYSTEILPDAALEKTEFYNDWVRPNDDMIAGGSIAVARDRDQVFTLGACIRRRDRARSEDRFVAILDLLAGPLAHAWQASRRLAEANLELEGRAPKGAALLVLDQAGRPTFLNDAAAHLLGAGDMVQLLPGGRLRLGDPQVQARIEAALLAAAQRQTFAWRGSLGGGLPGAPHRPPYDMSISALAPGVVQGGITALILGGDSARVLVTLAQSATAEAPHDKAMRLLNLTLAEAQICLALAQGHGPAEIAAARRASLHTVRNQIKSAMARCGARRQTELVALVLRATE